MYTVISTSGDRTSDHKITVLKLYNWAPSSYRTQVTPNQLVMVIERPINLKATSILFPEDTVTLPQGRAFPRRLEIHIHVF